MFRRKKQTWLYRLKRHVYLKTTGARPLDEPAVQLYYLGIGTAIIFGVLMILRTTYRLFRNHLYGVTSGTNCHRN